jgi:hypothetical protein
MMKYWKRFPLAPHHIYITPFPSTDCAPQFAMPVIPDESAYADEIRNPAKGQYNKAISGSRLASAACGLGRDDEL